MEKKMKDCGYKVTLGRSEEVARLQSYFELEQTCSAWEANASSWFVIGGAGAHVVRLGVAGDVRGYCGGYGRGCLQKGGQAWGERGLFLGAIVEGAREKVVGYGAREGCCGGLARGGFFAMKKMKERDCYEGKF
ncbi:unnamed protein product [Dovyalis caffra]|uniref:Uncharacterized protein n=1 Tax=Dovyalis caffra TaxID=77055 RepID=A0AAV1SDV7_9ROSI|nr:unnamed protein product [Dovyalis caffra]